MKLHEKVIDALSTAFLVVAGLLGLLVSILDFIGVDFQKGFWSWLKGPLPVILLIVALLALALGLERYVRFRQIKRQLADLENALEKSTGGRLLEDYDELYDMAARLVLGAKRHVRATSLGLGHPKSPKHYRESLVEAMKRSKKGHKPIRVDVVLGSDFSQTSDQIHETAALRTKLYSDNGVMDLVRMYVINIPWGLDFLIVDEEHMIIGFPSIRVKELKLGLAFIAQPNLVREVTSWFDEFILNKALPYQEFSNLYPQQRAG